MDASLIACTSTTSRRTVASASPNTVSVCTPFVLCSVTLLTSSSVPVIPGTYMLPIGLLITGWCAQERVHWIATDIGFALIGIGAAASFQGLQAYVIDSFPRYAASALAAVSCFRSLAGFGFPLFAPYMYNALGYGKGDTILAAFVLGVGIPAYVTLVLSSLRIRPAILTRNYMQIGRVLLVWRAHTCVQQAREPGSTCSCHGSSSAKASAGRREVDVPMGLLWDILGLTLQYPLSHRHVCCINRLLYIALPSDTLCFLM